MRLKLCRTDELPPEGEMAGFDVDGIATPILVTVVGDEVVATGSICPHEDVSLLAGTIVGRDIVCPGHGYIFDLTTGACQHHPALRMRRYRIDVDGDQVWIDLLRDP
jgi:nitrite reductase/ring-hydroxylating ferredoxin subunit